MRILSRLPLGMVAMRTPPVAGMIQFDVVEKAPNLRPSKSWTTMSPEIACPLQRNRRLHCEMG